MIRVALLFFVLPLLTFSSQYEGIPVRVEGTPAFREATIQAWELVPLSLKVYVRSALVIRQVDDRGSPAYDCQPWEQAAQACFEGADLGEKAIRVIRPMWLVDRRVYTSHLVHEGWHLYADQHFYTAGGVAGEAAAIALQVAALRELGYRDVAWLEQAIGRHGLEIKYPR